MRGAIIHPGVAICPPIIGFTRRGSEEIDFSTWEKKKGLIEKAEMKVRK